MSHPPLRRRAARVVAAACLGLLASLALAPVAQAEDPKADTYVFDGRLGQDGKLAVTETISAGTWPQEITQRIATRAPIDENRFYRYDITGVKATIGQTDAKPKVTTEGDYLVVTVDTSAAGKEPLVISYDVAGTTRTERGSSTDLTVFTWRALQGLSMEVKDVTGQLRLAGVPELVDCTAGPPGTVDKCQLYAAGTHDAPMPVFQAGARGKGEQVTFTVGVGAGSLQPTAVVEETWSLDRAFTVNPLTVAAALGTLALGSALLYLLFRRTGLDHSHDGDLAPIASFRPIGDGESVFEVHDGVRPGHVGTVADERVDPVDVTATLLDLAVRGHLRITELPRGQHDLLDWSLTRTPNAADELAPFEQVILDAVAPEGGETLVSNLPATLAPSIGAVQDALYDEVVGRGWFDTRPDATRNSWRARGFIGLAVAAVAALALVAFTRFGLLALVLLLLAAGLLWIADRMPRRTQEGAKLVAGLGALSSLLATQPTDQMPRGREIAEISRLLPYAVVLGGKQRWMDALVRADADEAPDPTVVDWYHAPETWHLQALPTSLTQFVHTIQGQLFAR